MLLRKSSFLREIHGERQHDDKEKLRFLDRVDDRSAGSKSSHPSHHEAKNASTKALHKDIEGKRIKILIANNKMGRGDKNCQYQGGRSQQKGRMFDDEFAEKLIICSKDLAKLREISEPSKYYSQNGRYGVK